jgi:hypothetical protein
VALEDILREHTLAYIGYPEKATMKDKVLRVLLSSVILPIRLGSSFRENLFRWLSRIIEMIKPSEKEDSVDHDETTELDDS